MALKDTWKDKVNGEDIVNAEDINSIARAVIEIEENPTTGDFDLNDAAENMANVSSLDSTDSFIVYDLPEKATKRLTWYYLQQLIKNSFNGRLTASGITDEAGTGYVATIPELEDDAVLALASDIAAALVNYYTKGETYSREEIDSRISTIPKFDIEVVEKLPGTDISDTTIYLVSTAGDTENLFSEYIHVNGYWEPLGSQKIDLSGYARKEEIPTKLSELSGDSDHRTVTDAEKAEWDAKSTFSGNYADLTGKPAIPTVPTKVSAFDNDAGYVTGNELDAAVDDALTKAKESGEFDGADGKDGESGVYVGSGEMPENANVQIDPDGADEALVIPDVLQATGDSEEDTMSQKAITELFENFTSPGYIVTEAERVASAVQSTRTAKSLVFPIMSDFHLFSENSAHDASLTSAKYAGMGISQLNKRIHLDFVGYLGDYTWGAADHTAEQVMKDITLAKEAVGTHDTEIWCVGNHDINYGKNRDRLLTLDEVYSYIGATSDGVKPYVDIERCYGYMDFANQKVRVIYLNTCDVSDWEVTEGVAARAEWVSPTQIQWLADTALDVTDKDVPSEWSIVIMGHHPLHYSYNCFDKVMILLEAYRDGKSGTLSCQKNAGTHETISYNFANTERAEIICNIHGHNHNCGFSKISSTTRHGTEDVAPWLWRFCIPNISANRYNTGAEVGELYGEYNADGSIVKWEKISGTAKATSFCVVNIDRKNKKVYAYIFGAGKDRVFSYDEEYIPAEYNISITTQNCTASSDNPTTITENGIATLLFTADDGYALPDSITVTGASYTWDKASGTLTLSGPTSDVTVSVTAVESVVEPTYTNQIPISTDTDGSIYNGIGYMPDSYLSSSGTVGTKTDYGVTGFIPIPAVTSHTQGQVALYLKDIEAIASDTYVRLAFYNSEKVFTKLGRPIDGTEGYTQYKINYWIGEDGYINKFDLSTFIMTQIGNGANTSDYSYIRICAPGLDGDSIITVNEPID